MWALHLSSIWQTFNPSFIKILHAKCYGSILLHFSVALTFMWWAWPEMRVLHVISIRDWSFINILNAVQEIQSRHETASCLKRKHFFKSTKTVEWVKFKAVSKTAIPCHKCAHNLMTSVHIGHLLDRFHSMYLLQPKMCT